MTVSADTPNKSTITEQIESLTGYEEQAIADQFGAEVFDLLEARTPTKAGRALIFVDQQRKGLDVAAAKAHAMGLTLREADAYFADEPDEVDETEPETPVGKGDSAPE